jgi:hypothetical protein
LKLLQKKIFFLFSFEEAFALLVREIETIRRDVMAKNNNNENHSQILSHQHSLPFTPSDNNNSMSLIFIFKFYSFKFNLTSRFIRIE